MCDGWRDDRCDEGGEGSRDEERQVDHHGVTRERVSARVSVCLSSLVNV